MSVIRVNPPSIESYRRSASQQFDQMRSELGSLARDVVSVPYFGPDAYDFKVQCSQLAVGYADALITDLRGIADAVRGSTTNISAALGGRTVDIEFDGSPVVAPDVAAADETVDLDTSALEALRSVITSRFASLREELQAHLSMLQGTDWEGTAKQGAVDIVQQFTNSARAKADEAESNLNQTIDTQIASVLAAGR